MGHTVLLLILCVCVWGGGGGAQITVKDMTSILLENDMEGQYASYSYWINS